MSYRVLLIFCCLFNFFSCEDDESVEPVQEENVRTYKNSEKPENNDLITGKSTFGSNDGFSQYTFSEKSFVNGFYVVGELNKGNSTSVNVDADDFIDYFDPVLIKYDDNGSEVWSLPRRPGFSIRRMKVIEPGILDGDEYILLSGYDENENDPDDPDRTRLMLFNSEGVVQDPSYVKDFFMSIWDMIYVGSSGQNANFIGVGVTVKSSNGKRYPKFFRFTVNKLTKQISDQEIIDLSDIDNDGVKDELYEDVRFMNIIQIPNGNYIVSAERQQKNTDTDEIRLYEFSPDNLYGHLQWHSRLANDGDLIRNRIGGLFYYAGNAILTGYVNDSNKGGSGDSYKSPYIYSYNLNAEDVNFSFRYAITENPDFLYQSKIVDGNIVACGVSSRFHCGTSCEEQYTIGNGWFFKVNAITGERLSNITFGSDLLRTQIYNFVEIQNRIYGIGLEQTTLQKSKGLIVEFNKNSL